MNRASLVAISCLVLAACRASSAPAADTPPAATAYGLQYQITLEPLEGNAYAAITLRQDTPLLLEARFRLSGERWTDFSGDGRIEERDGRLVWQPPEDGGTLRWRVALDHRRGEAFDARLTPGWALFRGEDVFPAAATRTRKGAYSQSTLTVQAPEGWSVVTPYAEEDERFLVVNPERRFDRPTGWMVAGDLGVRRDVIAGSEVVVAGPVDHGIRRLDILALMNWSLPELDRLLPDLPERLTIVSAGEPMWRGALSGPDSLYVHAERPLISENGTSTLLHELLHIALGRDSGPGADWIIEGLAEYYSIEILRRTGSVTGARNRDTLADLASWGKQARTLRKRHSTGATTARAVGVFHRLDREIRSRTGGESSLDEVLRQLANGDGDLEFDELENVVTGILGEESQTLADPKFRRLLDAAAD